MPVELISCHGCGRKNDVRRSVCLNCGCDLTSRDKKPTYAYKRTEEAAALILKSASMLFRQINETLERGEIETEWLLDFSMEFVCYTLHLLDRTLSDLERAGMAPDRSKLMDELIITICDWQCFSLKQLGFEIARKDLVDRFAILYNQRQKEYGNFKEDWYSRVSLRFGQHGAEAMELIGTSKEGFTVLNSSLVASAISTELLPSLLKILFTDV